MKKTAESRLRKNEHAKGLGAFIAATETPVIREDTDLTLPEDDLFISGGTGPNELMNGIFWKR